MTVVEIAVGARPLHALISQVLVACTIEADNAFERRMAEAGDHGARLSLFAWFNLMRFLARAPATVGELARMAIAPVERMKAQLACLERWRFVLLGEDVGTGAVRRAGWGSSRGIALDGPVRLTARGQQAAAIWPGLLDEIERRWCDRLGDAMDGLRTPLHGIADGAPRALPLFLPLGLATDAAQDQLGCRREVATTLPGLLSQTLLLFALEFDRESGTPLALCANAIRVIGDGTIPEGDLPRLTGCSPETSGVRWQLKPYVTVTPDTQRRRGKIVRLTPRGLQAARDYAHIVSMIEARWQAQYGRDTIARLRRSLKALFATPSGEMAPLVRALIPPPGTARAGEQVPALGRHAVDAAARQRMRDLVAQTQTFLRDPAGTLPHYPLWDMNRGYGP